MTSVELVRTPHDDNHHTRAASSSASSGSIPGTRLTPKSRIIMVLILIMCTTAVTVTRFPNVVDNYSHTQGKIVAKTDEILTIPLQPKKESLMGSRHYYMLPQSPSSKAVGVLVVIHPCQRSGLDFFQLPEDRIVARDALNKGLAVLSLTSKDRQSGCFTGEDAPLVRDIVDQWTTLHGLQKVPRFGLGMSSGASFLFFVYKSLKLDSMAVYNSPQGFLPDDIDDNAMIPTAFVYMSLDKPLGKRIRDYRKELSMAKVPSMVVRISSRPFTRTICASRFPEILPKDCDRIFDLLQNDFNQMLDRDGFLVQDSVALSEDWKGFADALDLEAWTDDLHYQTSKTSAGHFWVYAGLEQEIRTCHAHHGMSSERHSVILDFLMTAPDQMDNNGGDG